MGLDEGLGRGLLESLQPAGFARGPEEDGAAPVVENQLPSLPARVDFDDRLLVREGEILLWEPFIDPQFNAKFRMNLARSASFLASTPRIPRGLRSPASRYDAQEGRPIAVIVSDSS
jgi:hypothetical protein